MNKSKLNWGYVFIAPWLIGFLLFVVYPLITSLRYSFSKVIIAATGVKLVPVGIENYVFGFTLDPSFTNGMKQVATQLLLQIPLIIVISIILAMLLNSKFKGIGVFRTIYFLPVIVLCGPITEYMTKLGLLGDSKLAEMEWYQSLAEVKFFLVQIIVYLISNISTILWFSGISVLIFLVLIQKINPDLYEASEMDGATAWEKFWKVTLPELKVGINLNIVYLVVFMGTFEGNGVIIRIKDNMFDSSYGLGYAAMQSWIYMLCMFLILLVLLFVVNGIPRRDKPKELINNNLKKEKRIKFTLKGREKKNEKTESIV